MNTNTNKPPTVSDLKEGDTLLTRNGVTKKVHQIWEKIISFEYSDGTRTRELIKSINRKFESGYYSII